MRQSGTEIRTWVPKPQAATLVVAASDSLHPERADHVCDGTDDQVQIQAAIDALPSVGGEIKVLEGTYSLGTSVISVSKDFVFLNFHDAKLEYSGTGHCIEVAGTPGGNSLRGFKCDIGKLTATGNAVSSATAVGIYFRHVSFGAEVWVNIHNFEAGIGIQLDSQVSPMAYCGLINFRKSMLFACKYGVKFTGDESIHACKFEQLWWSPGCNDGKGIYDATTSSCHARWNIYGVVYIENTTYTGCIGIDVQGKNNSVELMIQDGPFANSIKSTEPFTILDCNSGALSNIDVPIESLVISEGYIDLQYNSQVNILNNGNFEVGDPPTRWVGVAATLARESTIIKICNHSIKITANDAVGVGWGSCVQTISDIDRYKGRKLTLGAWVRASSSNDKTQIMIISDSTGLDQSIDIPKDDDWHWITMSRIIDAGTTYIKSGFVVKYTAADTDDILYVGAAMLVEGSSCPAFSPKPDDELINHCSGNYALSQYESGHVVHTNLGAGGAITFTLPQTVVAGTVFRFSVMAAQALRIDPGAAGAIYINGAKQIDDRYIWADDEAESVDLVADGNGDWIARNVVGTWGVE